MKRMIVSVLCSLPLLASAQAAPQSPAASAAPQAQRPPTAVTKVEGTDNVYVFRNGNHQAMFVVTNAGVIATDPIAYGRPTGGQQYVEAIRSVTSQPIRYLVYSHHHFDHIAGGKAFKDAGATVIAHRRVRERLAPINDPHTVLPDEVFGDEGRTLTLGGTTLELKYFGLNHSDSNIVMHLPREKLVFVVDTIPVGQIPGRGMIDFHPVEAEEFMRKVMALDWDRLIPGHPGPNDRLGTKKDVADQLELLQKASAEMKKLAQEGKCWDAAEREFKLPGYENWPGYATNLQFIARRYCGYWGRGT